MIKKTVVSSESKLNNEISRLINFLCSLIKRSQKIHHIFYFFSLDFDHHQLLKDIACTSFLIEIREFATQSISNIHLKSKNSFHHQKSTVSSSINILNKIQRCFVELESLNVQKRFMSLKRIVNRDCQLSNLRCKVKIKLNTCSVKKICEKYTS